MNRFLVSPAPWRVGTHGPAARNPHGGPGQEPPGADGFSGFLSVARSISQVEKGRNPGDGYRRTWGRAPVLSTKRRGTGNDRQFAVTLDLVSRVAGTNLVADTGIVLDEVHERVVHVRHHMFQRLHDCP